MVRRARKKDLETAAQMVRRLGELGAGEGRGFDERVGDLLELGCDLLDLEVGIVSQVEGDRYEILAVQQPPQGELAAGQVLSLEDTFCASTLAAGAPVGLHAVKGTPGASRAMFSDLGLASYIGAPIKVGGKTVGTLAFAASSPRRRDFTELELDCVRLMAGWIGSEQERNRLEDRLDTAYRDLASSKRAIEQMAIQDPVTRTLNRRAVLDRFANERSRAMREGVHVGLFLMNVDRLRELNSNFGHEAGDRILAEVAQRVVGSLRTYDHLGRFAGGEFLAVMPGCSLHQAAEIAERAREALESAPVTLDGSTVTVTGSFGVTSTDDPQLDSDALLAFADKALFLAKQAGRNCVKGTTPMQVVNQ